MPKCDFSNFIEITLWHGCSPVNLQHIFRTSFPKNTSGGLLLNLLSLSQFVAFFVQAVRQYLQIFLQFPFKLFLVLLLSFIKLGIQ